MENRGSWKRSQWDFILFIFGIFGFFIGVAGVVVLSKPTMISGFLLAGIALIYFNLKDE